MYIYMNFILKDGLRGNFIAWWGALTNEERWCHCCCHRFRYTGTIHVYCLALCNTNYRLFNDYDVCVKYQKTNQIVLAAVCGRPVCCIHTTDWLYYCRSYSL